MLTQRSSIAGSNVGARNVAPRTALQTARRTRCRRCATSNRRTAVASAGRRGAVPVFATAQLQALGTSLIQKAAKAASPGIFVAGAEGQIALRLLKDLAVAGEKVTAGVADLERAQAALKFAKKYELLDSDSLRNIKLIELDYSDADSLTGTIPRRGKVVIVDGDLIAGGNQADTLPAILSAAAEAQATPVIIISGPSAARGGKSSGGLFAFGGRTDGRARVAGIADKVGLDDYVIIQAAGLDPSGPPVTPQNLVVAESGTVDPATAGPVGLSEVYDVVTAVLAAPRLPIGPITLSIAGTGVNVGDVRGQLAAALSTIGEQNAAEAAAKKRAEAPAAGSGIFGFGPKQAAVKEPEVEEEEEEAPAKPSLFGFGGTRKIGKPAAAPEEEEEEEKPAAKPVGLFGFGTKKAQVQVEEEEEEEEEEPRAKSPLSLFGFGAKPVQAAEEEEEEEEEAAPARPASPFFLFGGGAPKQQQVAEPEEEVEEVSAGPFSFGTRRIKARAQQSGKVQELTPAQKAAQARAEAAEETKRRQQEARAQAEALRERRQKEAVEARAAALEAQRRKQEEARTAGAQAQRKREEEQGRRAGQGRAQTAEAQRRKQEEARAAAAEAARRKQEEARAAADAKRKQQEQARAAAADAARRKQEGAKAAAAEAAKKKQQDEARAKTEAAAKAREDERRRQEEARAAAAEAARKKQEEARARAEAAAKAKAEEQKRRAEEQKRKQAEAAKARAKAGTGTTRPGTPTGTARAGTKKPATQPVKQATQVKKPIIKNSGSSKDTNDSRGMISFGPRRR